MIAGESSLTLYDWALVVVTSIGLVGCLVFVVAYQVVSRGTWIRSMAGRYLMANSFLLGCLYAIVLVNRFDDAGVWRQRMTVALFAGFVFVTWGPAWLLLRTYRKGGKQLHETNT